MDIPAAIRYGSGRLSVLCTPPKLFLYIYIFFRLKNGGKHTSKCRACANNNRSRFQVISRVSLPF